MKTFWHQVGALCFLASAFHVNGALRDTSLTPTTGATKVCVDSPLQIIFNSIPELSKTGAIDIYSDDGQRIESINLATNLSTRVVGGVTVTNYPVIISGNSALIYAREKFDYGRGYYVLVEPSVFRTGNGSFAGITNKATWHFKTKSVVPKIGTTNLVVAADGTGDFATIQGAIDFLPDGNEAPVTIQIRNGTYHEIIHVNSRHNLTFRGEDRNKTVITYPDNARLNDSVFRAMFNVVANGIALENLTLHNSTPRGGSQAEALRVDGQRCHLRNANFISFQDTLKLSGAILAENCFVAGDVDFIWGSGTAYFTNCEIKTLKRETKGVNGYIVQSRNTDTNFGYVFVDCRLTAEPGTSNQILARIESDRFPDSHVAFINCAMGDHIKPEGWLVTTRSNSNASHNLLFWEYQTTDMTGKKKSDPSQRHPVSRQLTAEEAVRMRDVEFVFKGSPEQKHELPSSTPNIPAFPGAEGFAANITGGRGGRVIAVTNLNDNGPGSFRAALMQRGTRTIIFTVSGTIALRSPLDLKHGDVTVAGQTAPGDGICLKNYNFNISNAKNAIIRFIRFRPGDEAKIEIDGFSGSDFEDIMIDHCSVSWGIDESLSLYRGSNLTVQWTLISESLWASEHHKGAHGYGGIWGGTNATWHHNLLAHHSSRNPRFSRDGHNVDFRNNVIYNWGFNSIYGGERSTINLINNYLKAGPATERKCANRIVDAGMEGSRWFIAGNQIVGFPEISKNNWNGGVQNPYAPLETIRADKPFTFAPVRTQSAEDAYQLVLKNVGAVLPKRDSIDARIIEEVRAGTAKFGETYRGGGNGIINSQVTVGGWPELKSGTPPLDSDGDGMPDDWEKKFALNPNDASDGAQDKDRDGYTNLEEYLNATDPTQFIDYSKSENNLNLSNRE